MLRNCLERVDNWRSLYAPRRYNDQYNIKSQQCDTTSTWIPYNSPPRWNAMNTDSRPMSNYYVPSRVETYSNSQDLFPCQPHPPLNPLPLSPTTNSQQSQQSHTIARVIQEIKTHDIKNDSAKNLVYINAKMDNKEIAFRLDSGSDCCILPSHIIPKEKLKPTSGTLFAVNESNVALAGTYDTTLHIETRDGSLDIPVHFLVW